jgi:hypothetical protein
VAVILAPYDEISVTPELSNVNNFVCAPVIALLGLPFVFAVCVLVRGLLGGVKVVV